MEDVTVQALGIRAANLSNEVLRLRRFISEILNCSDVRCSMCARCIWLAQQIDPCTERKAHFDDSDPIRNFRGTGIRQTKRSKDKVNNG